MLKRTWGVRPDETGTVSREALIGALVDAATMLDLAGGYLEVAVGRAPTDIPDEMVMTGVLINWKSRASGVNEPEQAVSVTPQEPQHPHDREVLEAVKAGAEIRVEAGSTVSVEQPGVEPTEKNPDGFDYSKLAEEDVENEPVAAR